MVVNIVIFNEVPAVVLILDTCRFIDNTTRRLRRRENGVEMASYFHIWMSPGHFHVVLGPDHMGGSYPGYRKNISTSSQARSRLDMK